MSFVEFLQEMVDLFYGSISDTKVPVDDLLAAITNLNSVLQPCLVGGLVLGLIAFGVAEYKGRRRFWAIFICAMAGWFFGWLGAVIACALYMLSIFSGGERDEQETG